PSESRSKTALPIRPAPTTAPSTSLMCRFIPGSVVSEFSGEKGVRGSVRWIHIVNDAGRTLPAGWWVHGGRRPSPSAPGLRAQGLGGRPPLLPRGSGLGAWGLGAAAAPPPPRGVGLGAQGLGAPSPYSLSPTPYALRPKPSAHKLHHNPRMSRDRIVWAGLVVALCAGCRDEPEEIAARAPSSQTFHQAVEAVLPSVVYIQVEARPARMGGLFGLMPEPPPEQSPTEGAGSGIIVSEDGYILTSDHVVQKADRVSVMLHDRRQFEARVVARDPSTDVAVVKIDATGLPVARLGDSDRLRPGDWVLAVGSPLGLQFSVTAGVVSATGRAIGILAGQQRTAPLEHFIQTDAAINPGKDRKS